MGFTFKPMQEYIKLKSKKMKMRLITVSGKEADFFIVIAPSIMVSGYGETADKAKDSFEYNLNVFCEDMMRISNAKRNEELNKMGFYKHKIFAKDYSKAYVDVNGALQGIENASLNTLEVA